MAPDVHRPNDDPYALVGSAWPSESESSYTAAESNAADASTVASSQAESADDAARQTDSGMKGRTADSVSGGYSHVAAQLRQQSTDYSTISAWMLDASEKVRTAKTSISDLVSAGTSEIRYALDSETSGIAVTPSSAELTTKYRNDIQGVNSKLSVDLDAIGHSLHCDAGSSNTPSYASVPLTSTAQHPNPAAQVAAYNTGQNPVVEPHRLPEMPRATTQSAESLSTPGTPSAPSAPVAPHPTLAGLIAGSGPSGTPTAPSTSSAKSPSTPASAPAGQAHQPNEQHQPAKSPVLPRIPSIPLPDLPAAATSIATTVTSSVGHQLATTAPSAPGSAQTPVSTGITPGTSGVAPMPPAGLASIGGLTPPPVMQPVTPAPQGASPTPAPGVQAPSAPPSPQPAPRGPAADLGWIQKTYGLSPSLDLPRPDTNSVPALFIAGLPEDEAHLHRALATLRHAFDDAGWGQPLAVASIRKGFEIKTVYATADALSIHPSGVLLPDEVLPLDEMPGAPVAPELSGSLMVTEKLTALIPREWTVEGVLSTVPGGEASQSSEQYQELVESGELLACKDSRGRSDVDVDKALSVFARAAIGSAGCGDVDVESARLRGARWVGVQPSGYGEVLSRYHLSDAAESMSQGNWGEAVYSAEKYLSVQQSKAQVA